ncbi:ATP-binding cassette sub- F member 1 [Perkinsus olseni]|uniref:ATP-binding cassette sub- F member 1 n=1 Tax=Perkinsus olseni TaxID=32597 RepID=A0A7J6PFE0_PEROL|nr:ATP-binding cassette sub- F member 1 [Perkinsus olseni]
MGKAAKAKKAAKRTPEEKRADQMDDEAFPNDFVMDGAGNMLNRRDVIQALGERVEVIDGDDATFVKQSPAYRRH